MEIQQDQNNKVIVLAVLRLKSIIDQTEFNQEKMICNIQKPDIRDICFDIPYNLFCTFSRNSEVPGKYFFLLLVGQDQIEKCHSDFWNLPSGKDKNFPQNIDLSYQKI